MNPELTTLQTIAVFILPMIFAITVHEVAHGWMASKLGDNTAKAAGRLTLNPIRHIDPVGTLLLPILMAIMHLPVLGAAKPVPVNFGHLRHPKRDMALVALAGPGANLLMALGWTLLLKLAASTGDLLGPARLWLIYTAQAGMMINVAIMLFNLLPLPPLDGSKVAYSLMKPQMAMRYMQIERYGFFLIYGLLLAYFMNIPPFNLVIHYLILVPFTFINNLLFSIAI